MQSLLTLATVPPLKLAHEHPAMDGEGLAGYFFRSAGVNDVAIETDGLFMLIFWFSVFFFVLLMGLAFYWSFFKYRRRPGVPIQRSPAHNGPLEIFWTVVPASGMLVIFFLGLWTYTSRQLVAGDSLQIDVKAMKWDWALTYPNGAESQWMILLDPGGTKSAPVFIVPEDTNIALTMSSQDVIHSFWIPDYRVKMDVFPNRYTGFAFRTAVLPEDAESDPEYGQYQDHWIFCAEYCGDFHSEMAGVLRVMTHAGYAKALDNFDIGNKSPIEIGKAVYASKCATCHTTDGGANTGPTWQNLFGYERPMSDGTTVMGDENYIRESILVPGAKIHAGFANAMPAFQGLLNDAQLDGVIAYMKSLSDRGPAPAATGGADEEAGEEGGAAGEQTDDTPDEPAHNAP
jgi:cytochrome c oxidase subunit 2